MSRLGSFIQGGLQSLNRDLGEPSFTFYGLSINCIPTTLEYATINSLAGREEEITLALIVDMDDLPEAVTVDMDTLTIDSTAWTADDYAPQPRGGHKLTYSGRVYRILRVKTSPDGSHITVICGSANR